MPGSVRGSGNFEFEDGTIFSTSYNEALESLPWGSGEENYAAWWHDYYGPTGPTRGLCIGYSPGHGVFDAPCDVEISLLISTNVDFLCEDGQTIRVSQIDGATNNGTCQACLPCASGAIRLNCPGDLEGHHRYVKSSLGSPGQCISCPAGQYGVDCAEECPAHATSPIGSTSVDDCFCVQGYERVDTAGGWECQMSAATFRFPSQNCTAFSTGDADVFFDTCARHTTNSPSSYVMNTILHSEVPLSTSSAFSDLQTCNQNKGNPTLAALNAALGTVVPPLMKCSHSSDPQACATIEIARTAPATHVDGMSSFSMSSSVSEGSLALEAAGEVGPIPLEGLNLVAGFAANMRTAWSDRQFMAAMGANVSLESNGFETGISLNSSIAGATSNDGRQYAAGTFSTTTVLGHRPSQRGFQVKTTISFASSSTPKNNPFQLTGQKDDAACAALSSLDSFYGSNLNMISGVGAVMQGGLQFAVSAAITEDAWPGESLGFFEQEPLAYFLGTGREHSMLVNRCNSSDLNRPFIIFSAGKLISTFMLMKLVEEGQLGLDDYVHQHLSWWSTTGPISEISLRHLLSFTSGLGENPCVWNRAMTLEQCAQDIHANSFGHMVSTKGLFGVPQPEASAVDPSSVRAGQYWLYSSSHLHIAAAMAEAASGETFNNLYIRMFDPQDTDAYSGWSIPSRSGQAGKSRRARGG